jgi:hypothetical protein
MRQHPDDFHDEGLDPYDGDNDGLEELGTPVYQGSSLSVRALTAEELQRFLDAHHDQPAELLGSGWAILDPSGQPLGVPWTPPAATPPAPAEPPSGSLGSPGRSALAAARRRRSEELAGWTRTLVWRAPLVAAAGLAGHVLAAQAGLPWAGLVGLVAAALLDRLTRDDYVVFHDLAVPGSLAYVDYLVIGPTGVFVIDTKQWTGSVHQSADGLAWHNHYPLDRTLERVRWEAEAVGRLLDTHTVALLCVHGAHVQGGGLHAQGVAIVPASPLRSALGYDRILSDADLELLATTAWTRLHPAA